MAATQIATLDSINTINLHYIGITMFNILRYFFARPSNQCFYLLVISLIAGLATTAHAREFEPRYLYGRANYNQQMDTPEEVFSYWKNRLSENNKCPHTYSELEQWGNYTVNGKIDLISVRTQPSSPPYEMNGSYHYCVMGSESIIITPDVECPIGTTLQRSGPSNSMTAKCVDSSIEPNNSCPAVGNPIIVATGTKMQIEVDYQNAAGALAYIRTYRSDNRGWKDNFENYFVDANQPSSNETFTGSCFYGIGSRTKKPFCFRYFHLIPSGPLDVSIYRANDPVLHFNSNNGSTSFTGIKDVLSPILDESGLEVGWKVFNSKKQMFETYNKDGVIQSATSPNGNEIYYHYSDASTPTVVAPYAGLLIRVSDNYGKEIKFSYNHEGRKETMVTPGGGVFEYSYNEFTSITLPGKVPVNNLTSVKNPDGTKKYYWYNEQENTQNTDLPYALTGITDERGVRFATWKYAYDGKAISSEHAGGRDKHTLQFLYHNSVRVTNSLGKETIYKFEDIAGTRRLVGVSGVATASCAGANKAYTYTPEGWLKSKTDWKGVQTTYSYNALGQEISRTEAFGLPEARTTTTEWHPTHYVKTKVTEPSKETVYSYDANGLLLNKTTNPLVAQ